MICSSQTSSTSSCEMEQSDKSVESSTKTRTPLLFRAVDRLGVDRDLAACTLCELFCSFLLMYGGASVSAARVVTHNSFDYSAPIGWGLWLIFALYAGFNISGTHLNPAISFMQYFIFGNISFRRFLCYSVAQFFGFFCGAALAFLIYYEGITAFDGGVRAVYGPTATADLFATYPKDYLSTFGAIIDQVLTTAMLCLVVVCITDARNRIPRQFQPLLLGLSMWAIISMWSQNCGAALNPARDLGPRVFTLLAGYGWEVFSYRNYKWFWVPLLAPMFGALLGGYVYQRFIGDFLPELTKDRTSTVLPFFQSSNCNCDGKNTVVKEATVWPASPSLAKTAFDTVCESP